MHVCSDIIQTLWIGQPTKFLELMIRSFEFHGHEVHLYCYEDINIKANKKDACEILPIDRVFHKKLPGSTDSYSPFSNLFRYKLLAEKGGFWVDSDTVCLRPYTFSSAFSSEGGYLPNVGVLRLDNPDFWQDVYETAERLSDNLTTWGQIGPKLIGQKLYEYEMLHMIDNPVKFCPIHWSFASKFLKDWSPPEESYSVHLWNEVFKRNNVSTEEFPKDSWLYAMCEKYGV